MSVGQAAVCQPGDRVPDNVLELVLRCYDAIISDLQNAKSSRLSGDFECGMDRVRHAQDLVTELLVGLDYEKGGPVAQNLGRIYNYVLRELINASRLQDAQTYDHLTGVFSELREAWQQLAAGN